MTFYTNLINHLSSLFDSMKIRWFTESIVRESYPLSGSKIIQLTSSPIISDNIYGEQPCCSSDGNRIAFLRYLHSADFNKELWVCDLEKLKITFIDKPILSIGCSAYKGFVYYETLRNRRRVLVKLSLDTFETEEVFDLSGLPKFMTLGTVSPDQRYYVNLVRLGIKRYGLIRLDLKKGSWKIIHEKSDIINPHPQFEPGKGNDILVQHNRGGVLDIAGNIVRLVGEEGATLYVIDKDGKNLRPLPVGKPYTPPITGHECWIGTTGEIILTISISPLEAHTKGNVLAVKPGDKKARVISKGFLLSHISASKDGKFFVGDALNLPSKPLILGSIKTGKTIVLCNTLTSAGSPQYTHPHPYITANNKWVIFNSDRTGVPQIYAASIPEDILDFLEE